MKNNIGLVDYAKKALKEGYGYVWGTYGLVLTETLLQAKIKQYPSEVGGYQTIIRQKWLNKKTVDCIGLIKSYLWYNEKTDKVMYDSKTDVNVGGMVNAAKVKGVISTIPDIPGICVYKQGHIGVYVGNNTVIEAHTTSKGVIQTPLKGLGATAWTGWLKVPYIDYIEELTLNQAVEYLTKNGYMDSPDYWKQNGVKGKVVPGEIAAFVIIKWAKSLMG